MNINIYQQTERVPITVQHRDYEVFDGKYGYWVWRCNHAGAEYITITHENLGGDEWYAGEILVCDGCGATKDEYSEHWTEPSEMFVGVDRG